MFKSTRGHPRRASFEQAILSGYAPDGGLWVPDSLPNITLDELRQWKLKSFPEICALVLQKFIQEEISSNDLNAITTSAFSTFEHHQGTPLPIIKVGNGVNDSLHLLETFHGPTLAFKDIGLQVLARLVDHFLEKRQSRATILMETSGDTGPAALSAAANLKNIDMYCLYPLGRVSRVQELQCTTAEPLGSNLHVYRTEGTTDDQAATIKAIFNDKEFVAAHSCCSMNSINVGRIATQSSYYVYTYLQVVQSVGDLLDFAIPTGAFGNSLGGFWAKKMGLPLRHLIVATNANDICHRAIATGNFSPSESVATVSPAMDIQLPYNFERFLHCLLGGNDNASKSLVPLLRIDQHGKRRLPDEIVRMIKEEGITSMACDDTETLNTVRKYWREHQYCLDPHGAIGVWAAEKFRRGNAASVQSVVQCVAVLTAHPSKFEEATLQAIGIAPPDMPERVRVLDTLAQSFETSLKTPHQRVLGGSAVPEWIETLKSDIARNAKATKSKL